MKDKGLNLNYGDFAENITTEGIDLLKIPLGTKLQIGEVILEITQHGKDATVNAKFLKLLETVLCQEKGFLPEF